MFTSGSTNLVTNDTNGQNDNFVTSNPLWTAPAVCGNGVVDSGEACDDSNANAGDGCNASCQMEIGFNCSGVPSACIRNMVINSGFEAGITGGWTVSSAAMASADNTVAYSGSASAKLTPATSSSTPQIRQLIGGIEAGRRYSFSAMIKTALSGSNAWSGAKFMVTWQTSAGRRTIGYASPYMKGTADWTRIQQTLTAPAGAVRVEVKFYTLYATGSAWMDDVTVTPQ